MRRQGLPLAYGLVTKRPIDAARMRSFTRPIREHARVRRDLTRLLLPQARCETLPRSRTFIPVERPDPLVDAVRRFLADTTL